MVARRTMKKRSKESIAINVSLCKYPVVRAVAKKRGWKLITEQDDISCVTLAFVPPLETILAHVPPP